MEVAIANPVGRKVRRTKSLKRKKSRKGRKRSNAWFGESARHSAARATGIAGPHYKGGAPMSMRKKRTKNPLGIVSNPQGGPMKSKKRSRRRSKLRRHKSRTRTVRVRRFKNPTSGSDVAKFLGGAIIGGLAARVIANKGAGMLEGMVPENMKAYLKPALAAAVPAAIYFVGDKVIKDEKMKMGAFAGSGFVAAESLIKAFAPEAAQSFLSDIGAMEVTNSALADLLVSDIAVGEGAETALLSEDVSEVEVGDDTSLTDDYAGEEVSDVGESWGSNFK